MLGKSLLILPITLAMFGQAICDALAFSQRVNLETRTSEVNALDTHTLEGWGYKNEVRLRGLRIKIGEQATISNRPSVINHQPIAQGNRVQIQLTVDKLIEREDENGNIETEWLELPPQASVSPGDVVRYTIAAENKSDRPVGNFTLTQPIPQQMVYLPNSVRGDNNARITYSIDRGETFTDNPTVEVILEDGSVATEPAPPDAYTHLRWTFVNPLPPTETVTQQFQVRVK